MLIVLDEELSQLALQRYNTVVVRYLNTDFTVQCTLHLIRASQMF